MACSPAGSSVHGILQARILEWVAISSFREIFPTQGLNLGLLHCRQIIYHLSHRESLLNSNINLEMSDTSNADSFTSRLHIDCKRAKLCTHIHFTTLFIDYQIISDLVSYTNHWPDAGSLKIINMSCP